MRQRCGLHTLMETTSHYLTSTMPTSRVRVIVLMNVLLVASGEGGGYIIHHYYTFDVVSHLVQLNSFL